MPLAVVRQEIASRFQEAQSFLSSVKLIEQSGALPRSSAEVNVQKGLFFVLLYGALEYSLTRIVTEVTVVINGLNVDLGHLVDSLHSLALDPELNACSDVGREKKWERRVELFRKQSSSSPAVLHDTAFLQQLENVWANTLSKVFMVYGMNVSALYSPRVKQYVDEVVDKRNAIAHGREAASDVGQRFTTRTLQNILDELYLEVQHVVSSFESHLTSRGFVLQSFRSLY